MTGAQYHAWADGCGANPYHVSEWTPAQRTSNEAFRRQKARDHFRWLARMTPRAWWDRQGLIDHVRADLRVAMAPAPVRDPYRACPCHRRPASALAPSPSIPAIPPEAVAEWVERQPFIREAMPPGVQAALAHLEGFRR